MLAVSDFSEDFAAYEVAAHLKVAAALLATGRFAEAAESASRGLELNPDAGGLWLVRAEAEYRLANFDVARRAFEHAALLVPLDGRRRCLLAECYGRTGDAAHARSALTLLVDDPNCDAAVLPLVAAGYGQLGDCDRALAVCRLAAERQPQEAAPHFGAAYYLRRLGYPAATIVPWAMRAFELESHVPLYRTTLALLLAESGRREEAYDLLRDQPIDGCGCPGRLRRMMTLFQAVGDHKRWQECSLRLRNMRSDD
jgi:Flp pilus assembly protein TadD